MRFGRRRSSLAAASVQSDSEPRRRNRLSKPLTGNSTKIQASTSASAPSLQVPAQTKNASSTELPISPLSPVSADASWQHIRNGVLAPETDNHSPIHTTKNDDSGWSVAYMVSQIEGQNAIAEASPKQQHQPEAVPPSPVKPQKRKSILLRRLSLHRSSSLIRTPSNERINSLKSETALTSTPNASLDRIADSPSIPPTRRSSFAPGTATRKLSPMTSKQDTQEHKAIEELEELEPSLAESDYFDWQPPAPRTTGRAGTPSDMGYSQLGGLRHGSLQIVNGRASPAFSEASKVSKQLLAVQTLHRDVSSDYGDAEEEFEQTNLLSSHNNSNDTVGRRVFSWEKDDDRAAPRTHPLQDVMGVEEENEPTPADDQTSLMAKEYIAELGASPFQEQIPSSPTGTIRRTRSEGSLWRASSCSSLQRSPSSEQDLSELSPVSPVDRSPSSSGSVGRRTSIETARGRSRQLLQVPTDDERQAGDSAMSWYSSVGSSIPVDEAFQSAVEFQVQLSHSQIGLQPPRAPEKSDSGYSSSNSLRSLQIAKPTPPPIEIEALPEVPDSHMTTPTTQSSRPPSFLGFRPSILKSRKTDPNIPTFANVRLSALSSDPAPPATKTAVPEPEAEISKHAKGRKKLMKKRRPLSQPPSQISVVRVKSFEEDHIPQVAPEARENLRVRSQAVPELEQTWQLHNTVGVGPSLSNLDLSKIEMRFPSPAPDQSLQVKRSRSRSRPRSWFGRSKTDMSTSRRNSGLSPAEAIAIINDFGTDGAILGRSPYDLSDQGTLPQRPKTSSVISAVPSYPRSMMDDKTAVELSRRRSRSIRESGSMVPERRPSFNDRGGIPGKNLRPASFIGDAPPITVEMLQKAYRTSSMQRQPSMSTDIAPTPPPHSPRPSYLAYTEDQYEDVAPPPPSHSPRPVDITPDPWAAQAAAWNARRKSAGEALRRQSWDSRKYGQYPKGVENEPLYPTIAARQQSHWTQCLSPEELSYSQELQKQRSRPLPCEQAYYPPHDGPRGQQNEHESAYVRQSRRNSMAHDDQYPRTIQSRETSRHRPLPSPRPSSGAGPSRPQSNANSTRSFASSMAEQLHPPKLERSHPPPAFGRYSGGMGFGYERGSGFGGSAGTRSASGMAEASRKGVALRAGFGVDLGDVPIGIMARG